MDGRQSWENTRDTSELYFLITKFLAAGPCQQTVNVLKQELQTHKILSRRLDWEGNENDQTFEELELKYPHIGPNHLLAICERLGPLLDREIKPSLPGLSSLLGAGRQSLLRTHKERKRVSLVDYSTRRRGCNLSETIGNYRQHNLVKVLIGRETSGPFKRRHAISTNIYNKLQLYCRTLGHLSAVYCLLFDRSGRYIITGADDFLVKVWSAIDGRLLATLRGASAEITDIAVNMENTLLATGSLDKILRVWSLQTTAPVAMLTGHTGMITSVHFCPMIRNNARYLVSTSNDGSVSFWSYQRLSVGKYHFSTKPIQYNERMRPGQAQMICAAFSPGGMFLAAGSADHHVRVYLMVGEEGPHRILEMEAHSDCVDSIQWANSGLRFVSGSKDGTAQVWRFECQQWRSLQLAMSTRLPGPTSADYDPKLKLKVSMVCWNRSDQWVITAVNDHSLKVWNSVTGQLVLVLKGHKDEVFVLESHPFDPNLLLSAGHDGQLIVWDIMSGTSIISFQNSIEGQGHGAVFDAKWSPDGTMVAATDSHGHLLIYGFGPGNERFRKLPKELFFHTDYRPLIRDSNHHVLDEQTQTPPHLMPPPFLVDIDGNPYPPKLQRLVPGRETCQGEQLIPNIAYLAGGQQEVIEGLPSDEPRSNIDQMIAALANRQLGADGAPPAESASPQRQLMSPRSGPRVGIRRNGDVEGVRQSSGNWQRDNNVNWNRGTLIKAVDIRILRNLWQKQGAQGNSEMEQYRLEMHRRPPDPPPAPPLAVLGKRLLHRGARGQLHHNYRTRAARELLLHTESQNTENNEMSESASSESDHNNDDSTAREEDLASMSSSSDSESSEYSDWVADAGVNLEPPKRSPVRRAARAHGNERPVRQKRKIVPGVSLLGEVPEAFRPAEWLSEVIPRKAPYYPQMGDEIIYFRQGHKLYLNAVRNKKVYEVGTRSEPWAKQTIRAHELVKVIGIKYEIRPPRLCCLKLGLMDNDGRLTGENFTIKYHDMADVLDFLVLRQTYDTAVSRNWRAGDRFRCMIDDSWWMGVIESQSPLEHEFPDSQFMCYQVRWDNGEYERMSPWDLEPINEDRLPRITGGAVAVLPEEIQAILYQPQAEEWPMGDRDAACRRILTGLDQVMTLSIAEPFVAPVDLNQYPSYAFVVEYPIDLSTIKGRFENRFYRRVTSAQFDVRYIATNAEKFNEPGSQIVKKARLVTELCLKIIKDRSVVNVSALYHQLLDTYQSSSSESEVDVDEPGPSNGRRRSSRLTSKRNQLHLRSNTKPRDWRIECRQLLDTMWQSGDSAPCPATVAGVKPAEQVTAEDLAGKYQRCISSPITSNKGASLDQHQTDFHSRERLASSSSASVESPAVANNMRLVEHHGSSCNDSILNGINADVNTSVDPSSECYRKMGEEKSKKMSASKSPVDNCVVLSENNNCSDLRGETCDSDSSEELQYGPGIVNKLKDKYMSMTLRGTKNLTKSSIAHMRRATSLENIVDTDTLETGKPPQIKAVIRFPNRKNVAKGSNKLQQESQQHQRFRPQNRGNESMKRARSVEALLRYDPKSQSSGLLAYEGNGSKSREATQRVPRLHLQKAKSLFKDDIVIVENKSKGDTVAAAEDRTTMAKLFGTQRKSSTSGTSEGELPPPDVVKQTLKIFEQTAVSGTGKLSSVTQGKVNVNVNKPTVLPKPPSDKVRHNVPGRKVTQKKLQQHPSLDKQSKPASLKSRVPSPPSSPSRIKSPSPSGERPPSVLKDVESRALSPVSINTILQNGRVGSPTTGGTFNENEVPESTVKHISPSSLESIRKSGTTEVFQFPSASPELDKNKTYLPGLQIVSTRTLKSPSPLPTADSPTRRTPNLKSPDSPQSQKQIGIIKPMTHNKITSSPSPALTHREREKNIINREKSSEAEVNSKRTEDLSVSSVKSYVEECINEPIFQKRILKETKGPGLWDNKLQGNQQCFNFVNSKTSIPDYIPNDGLIYSKTVKFEGDSGVMRIAGAIGDESSTDVDVDGFLGPPSPCNVEFEGANVLINGRSNLRKESSHRKMRITFDDGATTTFEYPSESSLLEDMVPSGGLTSPMGGSLASYTPSKVLLGNEGFQLGVTRAVSSPVPPPKSEASAEIEGGDYLKPAEDDEVVTWSAGKTADLLF